MSQIKIQNLTFCYEGSFDNIFENVSFVIDTDWKLGFTGRNGRGKTTFLNLLMGKYSYSGSIVADCSFDYFPYVIPDKTKMTIEIVEEIHPDYLYWELSRELHLLDVDEELLYRPFHTLSGGEQIKVLLAVLFLKENAFLLIDEPTNHLDTEGRKKVAAYLNRKKGFILVSHDRHFLDACVDHVLSINKANIEIQKGNFTSWYQNKQLQDRYEIEKNEKLKKEIKRLTQTAREKSNWSDRVEATKIGTHQGDRGRIGHLAAKMMKRSKAIEVRKERQIDEKTKLLKNIETTENLKIHGLSYHADRLAELKDVCCFYGQKQVCSHVSLLVRQGERINISGKNGCGKSTVLKLICGEDIGYIGEFYKAPNLKISYVSQDTSDLKGSLDDYARCCNIDGTLFRSILRKLDFARVQFEKDLLSLSEGQKKKILIARSLSSQAHLYVWDEPLNFIDVFSRMQIEELILAYRPTLLFVEHDEAFCENIATGKINL